MCTTTVIRRRLATAGAALLLASQVCAQEGRPDFSGVWTSSTRPNAPPSAGARAGSLPLTEEGQRRRAEYQQLIQPVLDSSPTGTGQDNPGAYCVTYGMPSMMLSVGAYPIEFIQRPEQLTIVFEIEGEIRRIYMGDRALPEQRRFPNRQGYSAGRWEGNTLVVETTSLTDGQDQAGFPHSDQARITERFSMDTDDNGAKVISYEMTMTDPVYYTQAVTATDRWAPIPNGQIIPYNCPEEPWLKLLELRRAQLEAGVPITATMADVYRSEMYE
jgi:hypothetical protein